MARISVLTEHLSFIPKIYDTLINPDGWPDVLDEFAELCGAGASGLMLGDNVFPEISRFIVNGRFVGFDNSGYADKFGEMDAKALGVVLQHPVHTWLTEEEAMGMPASENPGNQYQAEHWGVDRRVGCCLHKSSVWIDGMSLNYKVGRGSMTPEEEAVSQIFLPHFSKVVEISRPLFLLKQRFNAVLEVLDRLKIGVLITTSTGEIIIANREAEVCLDAANGIATSQTRKLMIRSSLHHDECARQIMAASQIESGADFSAVMKVPKRAGETPWLLEIFPLRDSIGSLDKGLEGAIIFITDPDRNDVISTAGMEKLFELSPAEHDICRLMVEGKKQTEIAEIRNVAPATIKTQAQSLYSKTDTENKLDLVRLALKVNLPVERASDD